ncbi:MAG TPA: response regulator [Clostridia bacterium]|nr:response regulator [Clostridia bacterium]
MAKRSKIVLCVDADAVLGNVRKLVIESFGYRVMAARTASEAAPLLLSHSISAVVIDRPDTNLDSAIRILHETSARVPIVLISGMPYVAPELANAIAGVVEKGDSPQQLRVVLDSVTRDRNEADRLAAPNPGATSEDAQSLDESAKRVR